MHHDMYACIIIAYGRKTSQPGHCEYYVYETEQTALLLIQEEYAIATS